jgi:hypothetical protein
MKKYECKILAIQVHHQTEADGDEIFLKLNNKKVWPANKAFELSNMTKSVEVNYFFDVDESCSAVDIELWEYDYIFIGSQCLGRFMLSITETGGPFTTDLSKADGVIAGYSLKWEVVQKKG